MALDKTKLSKAILDMMNAAQTQSWSKQQVADALAGAIDDYVRSGAVSTVVVTLPGGSGQASQSNSAGLR